MQDSVRGVSRAALLVVLVAAGALAEASSDWPNVDPRIAPALRGLLVQAAARFEKAGCAAVLGDFDDARTGRPLAETLAASGLQPASWLRSVYFVSGNGHAGCARPETLAYTPVGSPVVFVCPVGFGKYRRADRSFAANVLIHEALHTLGLAENPPSSWEITLRIESRCGR